MLKTEAKICFKFIAKFNQKLILVKNLATTIAALARAFGCRAAFLKFFDKGGPKRAMRKFSF
ncbi:hypothetical protein CAMRE0001_3287 [Campylobacter rectus RM3267]|uniref:Uncharacterized protein n=2 Tax=Campylobacter rectus TaxID=203 RepID=A0A6G5QML4_CAMRE|nr:hypothetical protein CAMRE0001_3287 [Campylobacter rectus RM3267]QCD46822.1 hypothetical protein CRECT_1162 [Campylobacter rectus]